MPRTWRTPLIRASASARSGWRRAAGPPPPALPRRHSRPVAARAASPIRAAIHRAALPSTSAPAIWMALALCSSRASRMHRTRSRPAGRAMATVSSSRYRHPPTSATAMCTRCLGWQRPGQPDEQTPQPTMAAPHGRRIASGSCSTRSAMRPIQSCTSWTRTAAMCNACLRASGHNSRTGRPMAHVSSSWAT